MLNYIDVIEKQNEIIKNQSDTISELSKLLIQYMTIEEMERVSAVKEKCF